MKKLLLIAVLLLTTSQTTFAQQAIAKIKFEEAEEAFAAKDYKTTITKLDEVEGILKSTNPKVMYLRIMAQSKIISHDPFNSYKINNTTIILCDKYLKVYENLPNNEDKYRDIYKASEALKLYQIEYKKIEGAINKAKEVVKNGSNMVAILDQVWMQTNLDVDHYRNGDPIPQVTDTTQWARLTTGAWCYLNFDTKNGDKYGKRYNWYAVNDPRGLAPEGWHVPNKHEVESLITYLGGKFRAGSKMMATSGWELSPQANNSTGFTALPGPKLSNGKLFPNIAAEFWTTTIMGNSDRVYTLECSQDRTGTSYTSKNDGCSVRCIKD